MEPNLLNDASHPVPELSAQQEHEKALLALQAEIQYHQDRVQNRSYLQAAFAKMHDFTDGSLQDLEIAYKTEEERPNSKTREDIEKLVEADQLSLNRQNVLANGLANLGQIASTLVGLKLGSGWGRIISGASMALNSTNPNDAREQQFLEAAVGGTMGILASDSLKTGLAMSSRLLGLSYAGSGFLIGQEIAQGVHAEPYAPPNVDEIYAPVSETSPPDSMLTPSFPPVSTEPLQFPDYLPTASAVAPLSTPVLAAAVNDVITAPPIDSATLATSMHPASVAP